MSQVTLVRPVHLSHEVKFCHYSRDFMEPIKVDVYWMVDSYGLGWVQVDNCWQQVNSIKEFVKAKAMTIVNAKYQKSVKSYCQSGTIKYDHQSGRNVRVYNGQIFSLR